jgi:hypothetical protein
MDGNMDIFCCVRSGANTIAMLLGDGDGGFVKVR